MERTSFRLPFSCFFWIGPQHKRWRSKKHAAILLPWLHWSHRCRMCVADLLASLFVAIVLVNTRKIEFFYITFPSMPLDSIWVDPTYTPGSYSWALPVWVTIRKSPIELPVPMQALLTNISCSFFCLELSFSLTGDPFCGLAPRWEAVYL